MMFRRFLLTGLGGVALAAGAWGAGAYRATMVAAESRVARRSSIIETSAGPLEYAVAGHGQPLMMIHGTGGGYDQGLLFAHGLVEAGFQIVAPSRFGYLRSAFPDDASPVHQADVLVELLDHLGLERIAVAGGSAGALTAAEFALRHPDRCAHLILIVPAANLTGRDPVEFTAVQRMAVERVLTSDAWFWAFATFAPETLLRTLLATDPALLDRVSPDERRRADLIRDGLMPISRKRLRDRAMHKAGVGHMREMSSVVTGIFLPMWRVRAYTLPEKINIWRGKLWSRAFFWNDLIRDDLAARLTTFDLPIYVLAGRHDYTTNAELSRAYVDAIEAPVKGFYLFDNSAHSPLFEEPERATRILLNDVLGRTNALTDAR